MLNQTDLARDLTLASSALTLSALLIARRWLPEIIAQPVQSFLPWLLAPTLLLAAVALATGSRVGLATVVLPIAAWAVLFVPQLVAAPDGVHSVDEFRVATQNLGTGGPAPELADVAVVAVQELTDRNRRAVTTTLDPDHPYAATVGTVGLWSRYPLTDIQRLDLGQGWARALRARMHTPTATVTVYTVHLGSVRFGDTDSRNRTLRTLSDLVHQDPADRLLVLGDLNTASTDPHLATLTDTLQDARSGFGFTWPSPFPLTRPDHILTRGFTTHAATVLPPTAGDHRATTATLTPQPPQDRR
ncbi:endonuclease/exonuclease/phosphatase family protein [Nocardia brasiliensis]|nr:endonuclease/exonuclease/phosphatase family protein [Nocardia brasiliensis]